jgi:putative hydrolase of the HAD superfamily
MKIVFDFGGVLFNWQPQQLLQRELPHLATDDATARSLSELFFQGYAGDWADFDRGTVSVPDLVARIASRTGLAASDVQRVIDGVPGELQPRTDTVAWLQRLHEEGRELYFLSNMPLPYADHLEATHGFLRRFRDGVFSARVRQIKPDAAIYELAAERFGARPEELLFMDDHEPNVKAARALGWHALHFIDAAQAEAQLAAAGVLEPVAAEGSTKG